MTHAPPSQPLRFREFYAQCFLAEHRHPINVTLHVAGTLASAAWVPWVVFAGAWYLVLLYPVVHAAPGLLGHRLFERNPAVGDLRVARTDYSPLWFIAGNHLLTLQLIGRLLRGSLGRGRAAVLRDRSE